MKNLMIYISPTGSFDNPRSDLASNDAGQLVKVQIENSLRLGWKREDIVLVTNFEFSYGNVTATVLNTVDFFDRKPQVSKINAIIKLIGEGVLKDGELYWFHDLDAFQLVPFTENEVSISSTQIAATDFGGGKFFRGEDRWSGGVFYFRVGSKDIFERIQKICYELKIDEEEALTILIQSDERERSRIKKINNSYNFIGYNLQDCYQKSIKPLKVAHFHPLVGKKRLGGVGKENAFRFFAGENELGIPLIPDTLVALLKKHFLA